MKITQEIVNELLSYDRATGTLYWKKRDQKYFPTWQSSQCWNGAWPGKPALNALDKKGYRVGSIFDKDYKAHRIIWLMHFGYLPDQIDHINGIKSDNRVENLREVTNHENHKNMGVQKNSRSGITGVHWLKREQLYRAKINVSGKEIVLGYFKNFEEAVKIRKQAEIEYKFHPNHGDRIRNA